MFTSTIDRRALARVIAVTNGKGGVGKTTTVSHTAALCALAGLRALIVDLDPQGNVADDLGYTDRTDNGMALLTALATGQPPEPLRDVRPGLDVVSGGAMLHGATGILDGIESSAGRDAAVLRLAAVLAPLAGQYDVVWLDCPPVLRKVMAAALVAAQFVIVPTKTDQSSIKGLREVAENFVAARELNPGLELLGVVLFGVTPSARLVRRQARQQVEQVLGGAAPVFTATIRHVEATATAVRQQGRLAHELESGARPGRGGSASSLAGDCQALAEEAMARFSGRVRELEAL